MFSSHVRSRILNSIAITTLVAGLSAAQALTPAGPKRPSAVPSNYVITPYGYFDPSCVAQLAQGDEVRKNEGLIRHANGSTDSIHVCAFAHFKTDGEKVVGDEHVSAQADTATAESASNPQAAKDPSIGHAWVEYAQTRTGTSFGEMYGYWKVPPAPSKNDGQTVYLFPGMDDIKDVVTIIQPVLGWNSDYVSSWGIASWNCCASGTVFEGAPARVNAGDTIFGIMYDTCKAGTLSCATWDIITEDLTNGHYSELLNTSSQGQTFNWAFAGALEVYNIAQCGDYPTNGAINFYNIGLYNDAFKLVSDPVWNITNASKGLTPQCSYGGYVPQQVTLTY
jgi:hypothetical protein